MKLNEEQTAAVEHRGSPLLILAGPGAGKTRTICERIRRVRETDPEIRVLAVTFTRKAAGEMKARLDGADRRTSVMTFHAFAARFLRHEHQAAGLPPGFPIWDEDARLKGLRDALEARNMRPKRIELRDTIRIFSFWKNQSLRPNDVPAYYDNDFRISKPGELSTALEHYAWYERHRTRMGAVDFDDMLLYTVTALTRDVAVREKWQNAFGHILIDEYQDTNRPQKDIVRLLADDNTNLCVVGDPDQSIYAWRGAEHRQIDNFAEEYGARTIQLHDNYRSGSLLVAAGRAVMEEETGATRRELRSARPKEEAGTIEIERPADPYDEARRMAVAAAADLASGRTCGILYRTNALSRPLERQLVQARVPYKVIGGFPFHERKEVRNALAWLTLMAEPHDGPAWRRIAEHETPNVGVKSLGEIIATARGANECPPPPSDEDAPPDLFANGEAHENHPEGYEDVPTWTVGPDPPAVPGAEGFSNVTPSGGNRALTLDIGGDEEYDPDAPKPGTMRRAAVDAVAERRVRGKAAKAIETLEATIRRLSAWARSEDRPSARLKHVFEESGLRERILASEEDENAADRLANIDALIEAAIEYERTTSNPDSRSFADDVILEVADPSRDDSDAALLMTMHSSKGLEFDSVYIVHALEDVTPHKNAMKPLAKAEERRLFYVAATRAKDSLLLSAPYKNAAWQEMRPSRYVKTIARSAQVEIPTDIPEEEW